MDTQVITAHIPSPLAKTVEGLALRLGRSKGWVVKQALAAWVEHEEQRHQQTHHALTEVSEGKVFDHLSLQTWAQSLNTGSQLPLPQQLAAPLPPPKGRKIHLSLQWTQQALLDLNRLFKRQAALDPQAATLRVQALLGAAEQAHKQPREPEQLEEFAPDEVRNLMIDHCELRYQLTRTQVVILRIW